MGDIEFKNINNDFEIEIGKQISGHPYADVWEKVLTTAGETQKLQAIQEIRAVPVAVGKKYMLSRQFRNVEDSRDLNIEEVYDNKCGKICEFVKGKLVQLFLNDKSILTNRRPTFATLITRHNHYVYGSTEPADGKPVLIYISDKNESGENTGTFTIYSTGDYDYTINKCLVDFGTDVGTIDINQSVTKVVKFDVLEILDAPRGGEAFPPPPPPRGGGAFPPEPPPPRGGGYVGGGSKKSRQKRRHNKNKSRKQKRQRRRR